jgi:TolB-like protein
MGIEIFSRRFGRLALWGLALSPFIAIAACQSDPRLRRVAVLEFEVAMPGDRDAHLSKTIAELVTASLAGDSRLGVVNRHDVVQGVAAFEPGGDPQKLQSLGRRLYADYLIAGSLSRLEDTYILNARLFSVATGETVPGTSFFKSFKREEELHPSIESVARFMAHQVAGYEARVRLAEQARTETPAARRP